MKHLFVINPAAGKNNDIDALTKDIKRVAEKNNWDYEIIGTTGPKDATRIVSEAGKTGEEYRVYAVGGDGTLHEVVNGAVGYPNLSITNIPAGSGNDFIKIFYDDAKAFRSVDSFSEVAEASFNLIECNGDYSINVTSVGLDARVGLGMNEFKNLPLVSGNGAYILSLLKHFVLGIWKPFQVEVDGEDLSGDYTLLCACNGRWYGGSFNPSLDAMPDDDKLNLFLVKKVSRLTVAKLVGAYQVGKGPEYPEYIRCMFGKEMKIRSQKPCIINLDGEGMEATELSFRLSDKRIRFFYPASASYQVNRVGD